MTTTRPVRAVLWDADGVLQQGYHSWSDALAGRVGPEVATRFGEAVWSRLDDALAGDLDMVAHVDAVIEEQGITDRREVLLGTWRDLDRLEDSRAVVADVRRSGVPCYLATNQDNLRASVMRADLAYDDLVDGSYYSCEVGVAKPSTEFFARIAADLGLDPGDLLFVDDLAVNVEGARAAGLRAVLWHHEHGIAGLRSELVGHGLRLTAVGA